MRKDLSTNISHVYFVSFFFFLIVLHSMIFGGGGVSLNDKAACLLENLLSLIK